MDFDTVKTETVKVGHIYRSSLGRLLFVTTIIESSNNTRYVKYYFLDEPEAISKASEYFFKRGFEEVS